MRRFVKHAMCAGLVQVIFYLHWPLSESRRRRNIRSTTLDVCGRVVGVNHGNATEKVFCSDEHERAVKFCSTGNQIRPQDDNNMAFFLPKARPYSLLSMPMHPLPKCSSVAEYQSSIKLGSRRWLNATDNDESVPSIFEPHDCYAPVVPPSKGKVCEILDQYSSVIFHGDSLSRHLRLAVYMTLRGNFTYTPFMTLDDVATNCKCDGIFSESRLCRKSEPYFEDQTNIHDIPGNLCPGSNFSIGQVMNAPFFERRGKVNPGKYIRWDEIECGLPTYKGLLLVLQGGLHWRMNATETYENMIRPILDHPKYRDCFMRQKVRTIWLGATAQSAKLDERFPLQSRTSALAFGRKIKSLLDASEYAEGIITLDWWNLTAESPTSDGLHSLTSVNLAKTAQVLYLADRWPFHKFRVLESEKTENTH